MRRSLHVHIEAEGQVLPLGKRRRLFAGREAATGEPMTKAHPLLRGFHKQERQGDG